MNFSLLWGNPICSVSGSHLVVLPCRRKAFKAPDDFHKTTAQDRVIPSQASPNHVSPAVLARFGKTRREGPLLGRVRRLLEVSSRTASSAHSITGYLSPPSSRSSLSVSLPISLEHASLHPSTHPSSVQYPISMVTQAPNHGAKHLPRPNHLPILPPSPQIPPSPFLESLRPVLASPLPSIPEGDETSTTEATAENGGSHA